MPVLRAGRDFDFPLTPVAANSHESPSVFWSFICDKIQGSFYASDAAELLLVGIHHMTERYLKNMLCLAPGEEPNGDKIQR